MDDPEIKHRRDLNLLLHLQGADCIAAEIGVAEGYFAADLLGWGLKTLYLVDAWSTLNIVGDASSPQRWHETNLRACRERVGKFGSRAVFLRGLSDAMAARVPDGSLDLIHIDAAHDYESVRRDLRAWFPKLRVNGIASGHDFLNTAYGVRRAVEHFAAERGLTVHLIPEDKEEDAGFWFRKIS